MSQTSYNIEQGEAYAGMKVDSRFDTVESKLMEAPANAAVPFGIGLMSGNEDAVNQVRRPAKTKSVLTASTDLVTSNSTIVTINGTALDPVVYADSHADTMAAIAAAIEADDAVLTATYPGSGDDITIIGADGVAIDASAVTTGGAGQPTWTQVQSDPGVVRGILVHRHVEKAQTTGVAALYDTDSADVLRVGEIWMPYTDTPEVDAALYFELGAAGSEGYATDESSGNIAVPGGKIREVNATLGLLKANINLPQ